MVSTAELFGGIGAMVLMHRTEFEIAQDDYSRALDAVSDKMAKLVAGGDLQKAFAGKATTTMADLLNTMRDALSDINNDLQQLNKLAARRNAAFEFFKAWAGNRAIVDDGRRFALADKGADSFTNFTDACEAGAAEALKMAQRQPTVDLDAGALDAALRHRPFQKE